MQIVNVRDIDRLRRTFAGDVILPEDAGFEEARALFNSMIERRPAVIAQCADVDDVVSAIRFAREHDLEIGVRGGGHGVAGTALSHGGLVIDLRRMCAVTVDPERRTATVGGGATMSHLDRAGEPHGLVTTGGRVSTTGVGGFVLGGGSGWFDRRFGLACDNLLDVELVTADGRIVRAGPDENPELFWALHGGGGNFGVATSFTFRLHHLPRVTAALLLWRPDDAAAVLRDYRDFMETAPDEVGGGVLFVTGPDEPFVPRHLVGQLTCAVLLTYAGPEAEARRVLEPMLSIERDGELIEEMTYAELQCMLDDPPGHRNYWSVEHLHSFPDAAVDAFCGLADGMIVPSPSQHVIFPMGGAVNRPPDDYPIPWRTAPWVVHPFGVWDDPADDERGRQWARNVRVGVEPWSTGAVYLNFIGGDEGADRVVAGLGAGNYDRLVAVKNEFDPDNVFHLNHNIKPRHGRGETPWQEKLQSV